MAHLVKKHSICIFVSSTFIDMEVERDIINNEILNQLRDDFAEMNVDIYFVDLRWGINTIDVDNTNKRNEKILKVCMSEIDRCHPYFIGLLGKRYGWTPDEELLYSCFLEDNLNHCRQFFSTDKLSVTALETYHALVQKNLDLNRCFLCQRDESVYSNIPASIRSIYIDQDHEKDLKHFQNRIKSFFSEKCKASHVVSYGGDWQEKRFVPDQSFYNLLYKGLYDAIQLDIQTELSFNNEIERENYYQDLFIERTSHNTIVRNDEIEGIEDILQKVNKGVILHAPSGQGKSTFLCQLYHRLINSNHFEILFYSAVASSKSSSMLNLIESLAYRIANLLGVDYEIVEKNYGNQFSRTDFSDFTGILGKGGYSESYIKEEMSYEQIILERLLNYSSIYKEQDRKPILILIDAYDRFEFSSLLHSMQWLKSLNVHFVITTISDMAMTSSTFASFQKKELPNFSIEEAMEYIRNNHSGKELHNTVIDAIVERKKDNGHYAYTSPLWLKLMVHVFTSLDITDFQNIELLQEDDKEKRIHNYMCDLVHQVPCSPGDALLFFVNKAETYIGRDFSTEVLQLLAFSGSGLREKDLEKLMEDRWSSLDFAVLHRWIRPYLIIGTENQWQLAHQLFVNAIKDKYKEESRVIYNRLLQLCMELPEDDMIRVKMGMLYAILAQQEYMDAVHYYTFECRLAENIQQATNILIDYLRTNPDYLNELTQMTEKWHKDYYDRFTAERILFTLGNQLYKQGLFKQAKQLFLFYEPVLENNTEGLYVSEFFLPMIYDRLAFIYDNEYNKEMSNHYKQKAQLLREDMTSRDSEEDDVSVHQDLSMEYANIINDLYERSEDQDYPYIEELFDPKFQKNKWTKSWLDEFLHVLGDIYASISCPSYHPRYEFWKQELPNAIKRYDTIIPYNESDWEIEINPIEPSFFFKYNAMLTFMEFLLKLLVQNYRDIALRMQHDCLCLYSSIASSQQNEHYFDECALGHNLAGSFYFENGEIEKAINANLLAVHYCSYAQNIYPNSIRIRKRYLFANHSLGRCLFSICKYEEALKPLNIYHDGIKEILENDPTQLTMVSSYLNALDIIGRCHLYLHNYNDALMDFDTMQTTIRTYLDDAPQSIYFSWVTMLFNCKYFIARCYIECGREDIGYQWANGLYNELLSNGIPHDADYEPMENVRELLGI